MKSELLVRLANEGLYYNRINIDPKNIKDPMIFPREVFFTIDGMRVAVKREDWEELQQSQTIEETGNLGI